MLTHYLWLNVFMWMLAEAYNLYLLFVMVFPSHGSYFITKIAVPSLSEWNMYDKKPQKFSKSDAS